MSEHEREAEVIATLLGAVISRRVARTLRQSYPRGAVLGVDDIALLAGAVAIPVLRTALLEDEPLRAFDEQEALEQAMESG